MRMLRVALTLLVLAAFLSVAVAVAWAAMAMPSSAGMPAMKPVSKPSVMPMPSSPAKLTVKSAAVPVKKPGQLPDMGPVKTSLKALIKNLKLSSVASLPADNSKASAAAKRSADKIVTDTGKNIAAAKAKPAEKPDIAGPQAMPKMRTMKQLSTMPGLSAGGAKMAPLPGAYLKIAMGL